jgi:hypothetical protein
MPNHDVNTVLKLLRSNRMRLDGLTPLLVQLLRSCILAAFRGGARSHTPGLNAA